MGALDLKTEFPDRLFRALDDCGMSQRELADLMSVSPATVSNWNRGKSFPGLEDLVKIAEYTKKPLQWFLGQNESTLDETECQGVRWVENIPDFITGEQRKQIQTGIHLFHSLVCENLDLEQIIGSRTFPGHSINDLYCAFQAALRSGAFHLTNVPQDYQQEAELKAKYPSLREDSVIVASIPQKNDGTLIRAEFISFLAATKAVTSLHHPRSVGLGSGYTILRMVEQTIPGQFTNTIWIPLIKYASEVGKNSYHSANYIALTMAARNPGTSALRLPYAHGEVPDDDERRAKAVSSEWDSIRAAFLTVNGPGRKNRSAKIPERLAQMRSADYLEFGELRDMHEEIVRIGLESKFGGELLGFMLDQYGKLFGGKEFEQKVAKIAYQIDLDSLRQIAIGGRVWVLAAREYKAEAVRMTIKSGHANGLVIDSEIAEYLIKNP